MKKNVISASLCVALSLSAGAVLAQSKPLGKQPSNLPPESYEGLQFVDNRGCVYIRSGYAGRTTWVPRVDQRRRHLCSKNYKPTFADTAVAAAETAGPDPKRTNPLASIFGTRKPKAKVEAEPAAVEPVAEIEPVVVPEPVVEPEVVAPEVQETEVASVEVPDVPEQPKKPKLTLAEILFGKQNAKAKKPQTLDNSGNLITAAPVPVPEARPASLAKPAQEVAVVEPEPEPLPEPEPEVVEPPKPVVVAAPEPKPEPKPEPVEVVPEPVEEEVQVAAVDPRLTVDEDVAKGVYVSVATLRDLDKAQELSTWFRRSGHSSVITPAASGGTVLVGPFRSESVAKAALAQAGGRGYKNAFITRR